MGRGTATDFAEYPASPMFGQNLGRCSVNSNAKFNGIGAQRNELTARLVGLGVRNYRQTRKIRRLQLSTVELANTPAIFRRAPPRTEMKPRQTL
jgi:hypothetical protein